MLRQFVRVRHSQYGFWNCIMRQNEPEPLDQPSQIVHLPARSGWPEYVSYPLQEDK